MTEPYNGMYSTSNKLEVSGGDWNKGHKEITSRRLNDGEFFGLFGSGY
jgi:hypothetical protein